MKKKYLVELVKGLAWLCFSSEVRIQKLEQLCRELYEEVERDNWVTAERHYKSRMEDLGLLDGEQND